MKNSRFLLMLFFILLWTLACGVNFGGQKTVDGSGVPASQERTVRTFKAVQVAGSADVTVTVGGEQSVVVEADDNLLPLIETVVRGDTLIIRTAVNTSINPELPIRVTVTAASLKSASITGSGTLLINGMDADDVEFILAGSGTITASGRADRVSISLPGSGNIQCDDLVAESAKVTINGSGNVSVYTSDELDVNIRGSGNVRYYGNPDTVSESIAGSGNLTSAP